MKALRPMGKWSRVMTAAFVVSLLGGCQTAQNNPSQAQAPAAQQPAVQAPVSKSPAAPAPASQGPAPQAPVPQAPAAGTSPTPAPAKTPAPASAQAPSSASAPVRQDPAVSAPGQLPAIEHVVIVIEENHSYPQIVGNPKAPYFNKLIKDGALLTNSYAVSHPSQPNYLALFSGSTQGMTSDSCGRTYAAANLASELQDKKLTFTGYSEDLPKAGYTGCSSKGYARKHNPWVQFTNVPADLNQPLSAFPADYSQLPTVSFVIPNHQDDMHDGTIEQADIWLKEHLSSYADWAATHHSLLLVTWDEDDNSKDNHIPTFFVGPMVKAGTYDAKVNHYSVLRTIEDLYKLTPLGESERQQPITSIWK